MKKVFIIGLVWPEPSSTAAGSRMLQLIAQFTEANYQVVFASVASKSEYSFDFSSLGIETHQLELNNSSFDTLIKKNDPSIVLYDRYISEEQFGWRVSETCANALQVLDTEDLHFLRHARHTAYKEGKDVSMSYLMNDCTKRELASIYRCDLSLIISSYEYQLLTDTFKISSSLLCYLPFLVDTLKAKEVCSAPAYDQRSNFMTIGNFRHEPNWNAVLYLKNTIWPLIRKQLPKAKLFIYGSYEAPKVLQLHNEKEGFIIKGRAESAAAVFKAAKICLAPLQFGAGLKGKLLDAMLYGTPSITTTIGAEGMHNQMDWNGFITDNPEEFAKKATALYTDEILWNTAQKQGVDLVNTLFAKDNFKTTLLDKLQAIQDDLENHRLYNITGAILSHHSHKSTKYLSKWIEEKNKD